MRTNNRTRQPLKNRSSICKKWLNPLLLAPLLMLLPPVSAPVSAAQAASLTPVTMCVFDIIGNNGPAHQALRTYKNAALKWGADISFKSYTDERVAAEEFNNGVCDLVNVPGIRARSYNQFTGSINSIGALPTYEHLKLVISTLHSKKAAKLMREGDYEILSITPTGALFGFVTDKSIDSPKKMAGKKITVLDNAPESQFLVSQTGMTPVSSTINNAIQKFNNGSVDITGAPAIAYEPMEMYKGLEPNGGVISWPFLQTTMQIVGRWEKLPEGFGQHSRDFVETDVDKFIAMAKISEETIPAKYWIPVNDDVKNHWNETFRQNRIALRDQGIYSGKALSLFRKVRCKLDPALAECTAEDRE